MFQAKAKWCLCLVGQCVCTAHATRFLSELLKHWLDITEYGVAGSLHNWLFQDRQEKAMQDQKAHFQPLFHIKKHSDSSRIWVPLEEPSGVITTPGTLEMPCGYPLCFWKPNAAERLHKLLFFNGDHKCGWWRASRPKGWLKHSSFCSRWHTRGYCVLHKRLPAADSWHWTETHLQGALALCQGLSQGWSTHLWNTSKML